VEAEQKQCKKNILNLLVAIIHKINAMQPAIAVLNPYLKHTTI